MRFLCVCAGGNVRSATLAYILKSKGHEAIAVGTDHTPPDTFKCFGQWADKILTVTCAINDKACERLPPELRHKLVMVGVGEDIWGPNYHQGMMQKGREVLQQHLGI